MAPTRSQPATSTVLVEQAYVPDIPVSILSDIRSKEYMKKRLDKVAEESAQGATLDADANEVGAFSDYKHDTHCVYSFCYMSRVNLSAIWRIFRVDWQRTEGAKSWKFRM